MRGRLSGAMTGPLCSTARSAIFRIAAFRQRLEVADSVSWRPSQKAAIRPAAKLAATSIRCKAQGPEKEHGCSPST